MKQLNLFGEEVIEDVKDNEISHKAKSYTGLYALHKYWGKKPYNIMADFIDKYTSPDEIVLDPFLGSGVSITEAVFKGRKGFGIDINPSAIFITSQILAKVNPKSIIAEFKSLENDLKEKINSFYTVNRNGENYLGQNYLWENQELTEVRFTNGTRNRQSETPTNEDIALAESFDIKNIKSYYPTSNFFHNSRINAKGTENVSKLFTPRNLNALSLLFERIEKIENSEIRDLFKFCFTSSIGQASKMVFVIKRRNKTKNNGNIIVSEKKEIGSWVIGYWQPKEFFENNVWTCFETRFKKILKAKKDQYSISNLHISSESFDELEKVGNYLLVNQPCQKYLKLIDDNSIDYILTDPPHGNRIPYLELSLLWNSWLKKDVNYEDEIIVSESKERKKNSTNYNELMNEAIKECLRVLKPERHFSFMFNSLDDDAWLNVVKTFHEIGFELEVIETLGYSANSVVQDNRKNGLQTDFIITYKKPKEIDLKRRLEIIDLMDYPDLVLQIINLKKKGYKPFQIMNNIFCEVLKKNQFFMISELFKTIENA
ncbi:MAG: DNA methyltransferase [Bacteroidales bacterium]|nr:DNA methyltransferase [Bacteroidales bacterium]